MLILYNGNPVGWDRHKLPCDGTDKYVPWTILGIRLPLCSSVVPSEQIVLRMRLQAWGSASKAITKRSVKQISVAQCQAKFLTFAKFLTYYFLSVILLLRVKE